MFRTLVCLLTFISFCPLARGKDGRPNIILIMADDVGIEGLECYGGKSYKTPNLNKLAENGVRFSHAFSQPLCTPTRVQLMTGKYNHRNWSSFGILNPAEKTFGHALSEAGYATGIFGKWQLQSYDPPDLPGAEKRRGTGMHPKDAGFDEYALFHALNTEDKGSRYANPTMLEGKAGSPGVVKTYDGKYGEDVWVEQILGFLDRNQEKPSFVYYPMALPHWPFQPTPNSAGWNPSLEQPTDLKYAGDMIEYMDTAVGNLVQGLEQRGMLEDTILIFYSDNGTHLKVTSELQDGRQIPGGKATTLQTAIHVPLIVHCPQRFKKSVSDQLVDASDFYPSLLELASVEPSDEMDGTSFVHALTGGDETETQASKRDMAFFWYDSRPGWDKERFRRSVFALDKDYKLFRDGRLFRLFDEPLKESWIDPRKMNDEDLAARDRLAGFIETQLAKSPEPPLVDAYGKPEIDLVQWSEGQDSAKLMSELLETGKQLSYGDAPEQKAWFFQPLDILPEETRPCVFFIHGGGWGGKPASLAPQSVYLQRRGFNTVSVHFRAPNKGLTPADTLRDVHAAYRFICERADELQIDKSRIFLSGGSAGGHLSLGLLTIDVGEPTLPIEPAGLLLFNPVIDLVDGWENGRKRCEKAGITPSEFSPAHLVRPKMPPVFIMSGSKDALISVEQLESFKQRTEALGNRCELSIYPDCEHAFFNFGRSENQYFLQTMWECERFLAEFK